MVAQIRGLSLSRRTHAVVTVLGVMAVLSVFSGCDKVPLLAPTGTVISLFPAATNVPLNGQVEIVATVIENGTTSTPTTGTGTTTAATSTAGAGTPVQNGTVVSFTTTIGRIEPAEARTNNGQVRVRFIAGSLSGSATVTAFSGGASAKLEKLLVGSAAAARIAVTANPTTLPSTGGSTEIIAHVEDEAGSALPGVPVTFTTDAGSISPTTTTTDGSGIARSTLTSATQAVVTATTGAQTGKVTVVLAAKSGLSVAASPQSTSTGVPVTFTITTAGTANLVDARIEYGDGSSDSLGTLGTSQSAQHVYESAGSYRVTVTARPAGSSTTESTGTSVTIGALPVTLSASTTTTTVGSSVTLTVGGTAGVQVREYRWLFDDGQAPRTTGGPQTSYVPNSRGNKTIRVDVIGLSGTNMGSNFVVINVN